MPTNSNDKNRRISILPGKEHLILCEGKDDEKFISCFLNSDVFSAVDVNIIQVQQVYGVDNLRLTVSVLTKSDGFSQLRSLLIIRDADNDIYSARQSVKGVFEKANLPIPPNEYQWNDNGKLKTGFLLMPLCSNESQTGALDDLCWNILSGKHGSLIRDDVACFIDSLEQAGKRSFIHKSKALLHTYFSATEGLIASSIGRASDAGAFDWHSEKLNSLKDFLISMVQSDNN